MAEEVETEVWEVGPEHETVAEEDLDTSVVPGDGPSPPRTTGGSEGPVTLVLYGL